MATSYPGGIDAFTNPTATDSLASATVPHATQHANANDAIEAIETELGTNPSGSEATVAARFTAIEATGWVTSTRIADGTIVNGDINAAAAIDLSKLATGALPTGITVASANLVNGTIVDEDVNASAAIAQSKIANLTTDLAAKAAYADMPYHVTIPTTTLPSASSAAYTTIYNAASIFNIRGYVSGGAINNYAEWSVLVAAGTYTLRTMYRTENNNGIASISIDGGAALGTTIDTYASSAANNNITDITGIALTAGRHTIRYTAASKNASSSSYNLQLHGFALTRTGA